MIDLKKTTIYYYIVQNFSELTSHLLAAFSLRRLIYLHLSSVKRHVFKNKQVFFFLFLDVKQM